MEEFTVFVKNRPGELGKVTSVLHSNGVNIESLATEGTREDGTIKFVTNDINSTRRALEGGRINFEVNNILVVKVLNRPGELAKLAQRLGAAKINVISIYLLGEGRFALRVDNPIKAREALREQLA